MPSDPKRPAIGLSRITETIAASFSSFYLTLISMIQGVALGLLAGKVPEIIDKVESAGIVGVIGLFYTLLTLIVLVIVWHEYVLSAQEFWWEIKWWDSFITFSLGLGEFLMIAYVGQGPNYFGWFLSATFTTAAGWAAYVNYGWWIKESDFEQPEAFKLFQREVKLGQWYLAIFTLVNLVSSGIVHRWHQPIFLTVLGGVFAILLAGMIYRRRLWRRKALQIYGWPT